MRISKRDIVKGFGVVVGLVGISLVVGSAFTMGMFLIGLAVGLGLGLYWRNLDETKE